jgi:lipopolysaccharide/colanic/teichoic acid biosynthesis glycosyltransferase
MPRRRETAQPDNLQNNNKIPVDNNPATIPGKRFQQVGLSPPARFSLWQKVIKRLLDVILSIFTLIITAPLSLIFAVMIKISDRGPVFFRQERIGLNGKLFMLLKFRTMIQDAEPDGPMLSDPDDPRVTPLGRFMRHHKIDEIPNFINVLKGEMSIVGPRPERLFYIKKLKEKNSDVDFLFIMKPGITCYGQVLYGYASDIDSMKERLKYEIDYIKAPSLLSDFSIMFQTIKLLARGRRGRTLSSSIQ